MFQKLQHKWGVSQGRLWLILLSFALGGSLCGRTAGLLLDVADIERGFIYVVLYILLVTLLWPPSVLLVSLPLGQGPFFRNYLGRIWHRLRKNS